MTTRRHFLQSSLVAGACFTVTACSNSKKAPSLFSNSVDDQAVYPQGIASGDPTENSVVLWTRVDADHLSQSSELEVVIEVSLERHFTDLVLRSTAKVTNSSDYTLRFLANNLTPDTTYYYRFLANNKWRSSTGRTRTAPDSSNDRAIKFAWASCQDYEGGFYTAWRHLVETHSKATHDNDIDFVLHVGDYIYESVGAKFSDAENAPFLTQESYLYDRETQRSRKIESLPSGGTPGRFGGQAATSLEDYRHIYRTYLTDPDLKAARAQYPFICIWDDHEFSDNGWRSGDLFGKKEALRNAATQAWFEFVPVVYLPERLENELLIDHRIFASHDDTQSSHDPITDLTLYRKFSFGQTIDLVVTDNRLFRSPPLIPMTWQKEYFQKNNLVKTPTLLEQLDSDSFSSISVDGVQLPRPQRDRVPATILGEKQKSWWKNTMKNSSKSWTVWANSVPLTSIKFKADHESSDCRSIGVHSDDSWAGYPTEKTELLNYIQQHQLSNVVSLSGDLHANVTAQIELSESSNTIHEFIIGALSSVSLFRILKLITPKGSQRAEYLFGSDPATEKQHLNQRMLEMTNLNQDCDDYAELLGYVDASANGYGIVNANRDEFNVTFIKFDHVFVNPKGTIHEYLTSIDNNNAKVTQRQFTLKSKH